MDFEKVPTMELSRPALDLDDFLKGVEVAPHLGLDTEGTGLSTQMLDGRAYAYGSSLCYYHPHYGKLSHYLPFRHRYGPNLDPRRLQQFRDTLNKRQQNGLGFDSHNGQHDLIALASLGVKWDGDMLCTLVGSHLINENWPKKKNLENCGQEYLGIGKLDKPETNDWERKTAWELYNYARQDAVLHYDLGQVIRPKMEAEGLFDYVWPQKLNTLKILIKMRSRGVLIDQELCEYMYKVGEEVLGDIKYEMDLNPGSPKDLYKLLIEDLGLPVVKYTKNKNPSFDSEAMEIYDEILERIDNPSAHLIKAYRGWQKATSACYLAYLNLVSPDGRLRTNYNLHRVLTSRLSSDNPNLQQIPRESNKPWNGRVKSAFLGKNGYVLLEGDYSQLEFRLGAAYAREPHLLEVFNDPTRDIFSEMADRLGMIRYDAKTQTYTINYGGGITRLSHVFGITPEEATERRANYFANYPNLKKVSDHIAYTAIKNGKIKLWNGRYRHMQYKSEAHKMFNSVMQGGAADIVEQAMHRLSTGVDNEECRMLMQVHDSIVFEVRKDKVEEYKPVIKEIMEDVRMLDGDDFGVKFAVDVHEWVKAA